MRNIEEAIGTASVSSELKVYKRVEDFSAPPRLFKID